MLGSSYSSYVTQGYTPLQFPSGWSYATPDQVIINQHAIDYATRAQQTNNWAISRLPFGVDNMRTRPVQTTALTAAGTNQSGSRVSYPSHSAIPTVSSLSYSDSPFPSVVTNSSSFVRSAQGTQSNFLAGAPVTTVPYHHHYGVPVPTQHPQATQLSNQFAVQPPYTLPYSPPQPLYIQNLSLGQQSLMPFQPASHFQAPSQPLYLQYQGAGRQYQTHPHQVTSQSPINYADWGFHAKARSMGIQANSKAYTDWSFVPQPLHGQTPQRQLPLPQSYAQQPQQREVSKSPETKTIEEQNFKFDYDRKNKKIVFVMDKTATPPLFSKYIAGTYISTVGREEKYTKALVFEQRIRAFANSFKGSLPNDLNDDNNLLKALGRQLKRSNDSTKNNALEIIERHRGDNQFIKDVRNTIIVGLNLDKNNTNMMVLLNQLHSNENLTKEDAGQIAKAISILKERSENVNSDILTIITTLSNENKGGKAPSPVTATTPSPASSTANRHPALIQAPIQAPIQTSERLL